MKRRDVKSKGEKERYKHLNAEFQKIAKKLKVGSTGSGVGVPVEYLRLVCIYWIKLTQVTFQNTWYIYFN